MSRLFLACITRRLRITNGHKFTPRDIDKILTGYLIWVIISSLNRTEGRQLKKQKMMAPMRLTEQQMKWVETEAARTGGSMAAVIRGLVQEKLEGK